MKKKLLLLIICLCVFNAYCQTIIIPETFEKSHVHKKSRTIRLAKIEDEKLLTISEATFFDSDSDGIFDHADIDDDNDGDVKIDEIVDADKEGIFDTFDTNTAIFGSQIDLEGKLSLYFDGINDYIEKTMEPIS